jgi:hypothetical protein
MLSKLEKKRFFCVKVQACDWPITKVENLSTVEKGFHHSHCYRDPRLSVIGATTVAHLHAWAFLTANWL